MLFGIRKQCHLLKTPAQMIDTCVCDNVGHWSVDSLQVDVIWSVDTLSRQRSCGMWVLITRKDQLVTHPNWAGESGEEIIIIVESRAASTGTKQSCIYGGQNSGFYPLTIVWLVNVRQITENGRLHTNCDHTSARARNLKERSFMPM